MSIYKPQSSQIYLYDFWRGGHRFSGSTGKKSKREALEIERLKRTEAERVLCDAEERKIRPMTFSEACGRYWLEVGQYAKSAGQIESHIDYLLKQLGEATPLNEIDDDKIAKLVARRRGEYVVKHMKPKKSKEPKPLKRVSNATVNRSTLEPLKRVLLRARNLWGQQVAPIRWREHKLAEPEERVRTLSADEEKRFFIALAQPYFPITYFAMRTGCRKMECINLKRSDIDWAARTIKILGKGGILKTVPLPIDVQEIIFPLTPTHDGYVFAAPAKENEPRCRMTERAYYAAVKAACRRAGIDDFRLHDLRHTAATRLLKATGNLKMAQKLLRHASIKTTAKYAHVFDDELRDALDAMTLQKVPRKIPWSKSNVLIKNRKM